MTLIFVSRCAVLAILLILTNQIEGGCSNTVQNFSGDCCINHYRDGNICKECPAGYYEEECNKLCPSPMYGYLCLQKCTCYPCHHIYGCNSTQDTKKCPEGYRGENCTDLCLPPTYGLGCNQTCNCSSCHHINGCNVTLENTESTMIAITDGTENITQTIERKKTYGNHSVTAKIVIIFTGATISLILIIVILRECYKYRQYIRPFQENNPTDVVYEIVDEI